MYACVRFADILRYDLIDKIPFRFIYNMRTALSELLWVIHLMSQSLLGCLSQSTSLILRRTKLFLRTLSCYCCAFYICLLVHQFSSRALGYLHNRTSSQGATVSAALQKILQCRWSFQCFLPRKIWMYKNCHEFIFTWKNISHFFLSEKGFVLAG